MLHNGFARIKCRVCNHEYLLAFSCKRRHFYPSCHVKRVIQFGEFACSNVLKNVPHRHFVFSNLTAWILLHVFQATSQTRMNRCCVTWVFTAMYAGAEGKNRGQQNQNMS
ncbi:MAG: transposase zinc-binding domain-containing protein [Actinobacteria bacterium]|nr:transposase zinc-binding domain-containing protein [Actinomycetota bacterium]